ncbi:hypothetical protein [Campylobacter sp. TTU_617]|uniref:hypothetical protein n=1 Tax=Campylobacter sp. TTU_617 TaxID=2768148 RepID=UPI001907665A|nr:hypothetical protein [Campylobacter sp. TTU_617]MBK1971977.1 hypothetical protein [Campylobacter sp. TTU_617]
MAAASLLLDKNPSFLKVEVEEFPWKFKAGPEFTCIVPLLPIVRVLPELLTV